MPSAPCDPSISRLVSTTLIHRGAPGAGAPSAGAATLAARVVPVSCLAA